MDKEDLAIIKAQANLILENKRVADQLAQLHQEDEDIDEVKIIHNFEWLHDKFKYFWFSDKTLESHIANQLPEVSFFTAIDFEKLVQSVLWLIEERAYKETSVTNDGGIDLFHEEITHDSSWDISMTSKTIVQCKLYGGYVPINEIRDFFGVMSAQTATGIFITTGKITNQAKEFIPMANLSPHSNRLFYLEGADWSDLLKISEKIHSLIHESTDSDDEKITSISNKINELQNFGKKIIYQKRRNQPNQGMLF